ncbi:MAG: helix-turn-helix domain-containing protein [Alkalilacustris sp.]
MVALPLPVVAGTILAFLLLLLLRQGRGVPWLCALLAGLVVQSGIVALAQNADMAPALWLQPVTAAALPPLAWLALSADGLGRAPGRGVTVHLVAPMATLGARLVAPTLLDALVPLVFAGYALAMASALRRAGPVLPRASLGRGAGPHRIWAAIAAALALSAASDAAIAAAFATGHGALAPLIRDVTTAALLLGLGALALVAGGMAGAPGGREAPPAAPDEDDRALFARLEALMVARTPWRDPDLTLAQLSRRLQVPAKRLSEAVNRVTGESISRHVNGHRIRAACAALAEGASVTEAMLGAGFATKSNFHREFRRITGQSPGAWLAAQPPAPPRASPHDEMRR